MTISQNEKAARFRALHEAPGAFVIPNPWDAGSARVLTALGFQALATSSGASAGILGRRDGKVTREEYLGAPQPVFDRADANKDGKLTPEEFRAFADQVRQSR